MKNKKDHEKNSEVFFLNEEVHNEPMQVQGRHFFRGLFFILIGVILLFNSLNIIPWQIWSEIITFWPILIINAGVQILFGGNRITEFIGSIISFLLFLFIFLIAFYTVSPETFEKLPVYFQLPARWFEELIS